MSEGQQPHDNAAAADAVIESNEESPESAPELGQNAAPKAPEAPEAAATNEASASADAAATDAESTEDLIETSGPSSPPLASTDDALDAFIAPPMPDIDSIEPIENSFDSETSYSRQAAEDITQTRDPSFTPPRPTHKSPAASPNLLQAPTPADEDSSSVASADLPTPISMPDLLSESQEDVILASLEVPPAAPRTTMDDLFSSTKDEEAFDALMTPQESDVAAAPSTPAPSTPTSAPPTPSYDFVTSPQADEVDTSRDSSANISRDTSGEYDLDLDPSKHKSFQTETTFDVDPDEESEILFKKGDPDFTQPDESNKPTRKCAFYIIAIVIFGLVLTVGGILSRRANESESLNAPETTKWAATEVPVEEKITEDPTTAPSDVPTDMPSVSPSTPPTELPSGTPSVMPTATPTATPKLQRCDAGCTSDDDCDTWLLCERIIDVGTTAFLGEECPGQEFRGQTSYCLQPVVSTNPNRERCHGNCNNDNDCNEGLICFNREQPNELVPGCRGGSADGSLNNYCTVDTNFEQRVYGSVNIQPLSRMPLCGTGCEYDGDCDIHLVCSTENDSSIESGCGDNNTPKCTYPRARGFGDSPLRNYYPFTACTGDCDADYDCAPGLYCRGPDGNGRLPGCVGGAGGASQFCVVIPEGERSPTAAPYSLPTATRNGDDDDEPITYVPGLLTVHKDELLLSQGLNARLLAVSERPVLMGDGTWSRRRYHRRPDGAATFPNPDGSGGFAYVSNSEEPQRGKGGVGAIYFDKDGNVIDYRRILNGTMMNCGGGSTPWGTWVSNEEWQNGQAWQVDPYDRRDPSPTQVGRDRGWWESFAFNNADPANPQFFATEDQRNGALARFRPTPEAVRNSADDPWRMLEGDGTLDYLVLDRNNGNSGTFTWTTDRGRARGSATSIYPNTEGIDVRNGIMYFVCKEIQVMFTLNLAAGTWTSRSTRNGIFDGGPDQMQRIMGDTRDMLYFTEEQGEGAGIHARDAQGRYHVIVTSDVLRGETTGLAFSPNGRYLFIAYQEMSKVFMIWRRDGLPFQAEKLDVKYHHVP